MATKATELSIVIIEIFSLLRQMLERGILAGSTSQQTWKVEVSCEALHGVLLTRNRVYIMKLLDRRSPVAEFMKGCFCPKS
jgi:hypothetical protein